MKDCPHIADNGTCECAGERCVTFSADGTPYCICQGGCNHAHHVRIGRFIHGEWVVSLVEIPSG